MTTKLQTARWAKTPIAVVNGEWQRFRRGDRMVEVLEGRPDEEYILEKSGDTAWQLTDVKCLTQPPSLT